MSKPTKSPEALMNYLVGEVMKQTQGRANPQVVRAMILERLEPTST